MAISVFVMQDERYQQHGVAVYRNVDEMFEAVQAIHRPAELNDEEIGAAVADFLNACEVAVIDEYPENGYFASDDDYKNALLCRIK